MFFFTEDQLTGLEKAKYNYATELELQASIAKLNDSFMKWKKLAVLNRKTMLCGLVLKLKEKQNIFTELIVAEMGKPILDAKLEVKKCIHTLEQLESIDLNFLDEVFINTKGKKSKITHEPLGVIYSIMPWNFPLWQFIRMAVPTLLSGNVILLKHSEITPLMGQAIEQLFSDVFTEGPIVVNHAISNQQTDFILSQNQIGGVSLTGSVNAGQVVYQTAAKYFKKTVLELGGSDPYIVFDDADINLAVKKIAIGRLRNAGQVCIAAKRAVVHISQLESFINLIKLEFDKYNFGNPLSPSTDIGPLAHTKFKKSLELQKLDFLKNTDAELIYTKNHSQNKSSAFVDAEIYLLKKNADWLKDQEFFAPILIIIPFENVNEAIEIANSTCFGLGAGVFSKNTELINEVSQLLVAGQIAINDVVTSDLILPFGGFKCSGMGRESGQQSYFEFTQTKVVTCLN